MNKKCDASNVSAIVTLANVMIVWGGLSMLVGVFVDIRFFLLGLLQVSTSVWECLIARKASFGNVGARAYTTIYLGAIFTFCIAGAFASFEDAMPAAFFFVSLSALALGCLVSIWKERDQKEVFKEKRNKNRSPRESPQGE